MIDYTNVGSMIAQHQQILDFTAGQTSLSFLPLSHIFERGWTLYVLVQGGKNVYVANPLKVKEAMQAIHPDALCVVPRVLENVCSYFRTSSTIFLVKTNTVSYIFYGG